MRKHAIFIAALALGCGRTGSVDDVPADAPIPEADGGDASQLVAPCPPLSIALRGQPCPSPGLICELSWGYKFSAEPLCDGWFACDADAGWVDFSNGHPCSGCPTDAEVPTGPCNELGAICLYPDAGATAVCTPCGNSDPDAGSSWSIIDAGAACAVRPRLGSACDDLSAVCQYPQEACCVGFTEKCDRGVWTGKRTTTCP